MKNSSLRPASARVSRLALHVAASGAIAALFPADVRAALFWNTNGTTASLTAANWGSSSAGPFTTAWTNSSDVVFSANSSITNVSNTPLGNMTVSPSAVVTWTPAGTFSTGGNVRTIFVGSGSIFDMGTQNVSTTAGTGLIKDGTGTMFSSNGNSYLGGFTLNSGTIVVGGVNAMGNGGQLTVNGGTIAANGNRDLSGKYTSFTVGGNFQLGAVTTGVITSNGNGTAASNLTINANPSFGATTRAITIGANGTYTLAGGITATGTAGLTVNANSGATGILNLTGANNYAGTTTLNGGTTRFGKETSLYNGATATWAAGNIVVNSGATAAFAVGGTGEFTGADIDLLKSLGSGTTGFQNGSFLGLDPSGATGSFVISSNITNTNSGANSLGITKLGTGTVSLAGNNSYTGPTNIQGGRLLVSSSTGLPSGTTVNYGTGASNAILEIGALNQTIANMTFGNNVSTLVVGATGTLTVSPGTLELAPVDSGNAYSLNMSGLTNFVYNNPTGTFSAACRQIAGGSSGASGNVTITLASASSATNTISALNFNIGSLGGGGSSSNGNPTLFNLGPSNTVNADNINIGSSGSRSRGVVAFGSTVTGGLLKIRNSAGTGAANVVVGRNASFNESINYASTLNTTGGSSSVDALINTLSAGISTSDGAAGRGARATGHVSFGAGTATITSATLGVVNFSGGNSAPTGSSFTGQGTLTLSGGGTTNIGTLTLAQDSLASISGTTTVTVSGQVNLGGTAGATTLNATTIQAGTIVSGETSRVMGINWNDGTIGNITGTNLSISGVSIVAAGSTAVHAFNISGPNTATISSVITGDGGITKLGTGKLTLSSSHGYTGNTNISNGTLNLANGTISTTAVTIATLASLTGNGTTGSLTIDGTLAPGNSIGTINSGALTIDSTGTFSPELDPTNVIADLVNVTGNLSIDAAATFSPSILSGSDAILPAGTYFTVIDYSGTPAGTFSGYSEGTVFTLGLNDYKVSYNGFYDASGVTHTDDTKMTLTVIPEPTSLGLVAIGAMGLIRRRRR